MQLMNRDTNITERIPEILETPDHFIINTQVYDKQTLKPISMKFANFLHNNLMSIILNTSIQNIYHENGYQNWITRRQRIGNYKNIIKDKQDENVFYIMTMYNNGIENALYKIKLNNDIYTVEKTLISSFRGFYKYNQPYSDLKIIYETETSFVIDMCTIYHDTWDYYGYIIGIIDKKTFSYTEVTASSESNYNQTFFMETDSNNVYVLRASYNNHIIYKINITNGSLIQVGETMSEQNYIMSNPIKINDYYYILFDNYSDTSGHRYGFRKVKLITGDNSTIIHEIKEIKNYDSFKMDSSENGSLPYGHEVWHQLQTFESNGNIYLTCTIYGQPEYIDNPYQCKHVLLELKEDGFYIKQIISLAEGCNGVLFVNEDYKKPIFKLVTSCVFYSFNEDTQQFIQTFSLCGTFITIGFDTTGRFIAQHKSGAVEIFSETNASILKADFNDEIYNLDDKQEIDTTVSFFAKNYLDEYIETSVKLTLIGPVIFKENNKNTLSISTLKSGIRTVPVTITGNGNIEVIITQNT